MKKKEATLSWEDIENQIHELAQQINKSGFRPDYIVGITRGGLVPAVLLSSILDVPMHTLKVSLRDGNDGPESNLWMSEDAFGYVQPSEQLIINSRWDSSKRKNILLVDDINDSGATFNWIQKDWQQSCFPSEDTVWKSIWNNTVRTAVIVENLDSSYETTYNAISINKREEDTWINFPWESGWWRKHKKDV